MNWEGSSIWATVLCSCVLVFACVVILSVYVLAYEVIVCVFLCICFFLWDVFLCVTRPQILAQGKSSPTAPPKQANKLDNMLGSLQSDLHKLGVQTVAKGVCGACNKPIVGQVTLHTHTHKHTEATFMQNTYRLHAHTHTYMHTHSHSTLLSLLHTFSGPFWMYFMFLGLFFIFWIS